jgi:hypothetical protein
MGILQFSALKKIAFFIAHHSDLWIVARECLLRVPTNSDIRFRSLEAAQILKQIVGKRIRTGLVPCEIRKEGELDRKGNEALQDRRASCFGTAGNRYRAEQRCEGCCCFRLSASESLCWDGGHDVKRGGGQQARQARQARQDLHRHRLVRVWGRV